MSKIKTVEELQTEVNELKTRMDLMKRERTQLSQNINSHKKQIEALEELILNNNQYEMFD